MLNKWALLITIMACIQLEGSPSTAAQGLGQVEPRQSHLVRISRAQVAYRANAQTFRDSQAAQTRAETRIHVNARGSPYKVASVSLRRWIDTSHSEGSSFGLLTLIA